jgi:transcriptional regulator with XRE-family HTH domain
MTSRVESNPLLIPQSTKSDKVRIMELVNGRSRVAADSLSLGEFIDQARRANGLSIRQLAELTGILKTTIGRFLLNQVNDPKPWQLMRLADVLELNAADLFLLAGQPAPTGPPTVEALLRTEFDLPEAAVREAKGHIEAIIARYQRGDATHKTTDPSRKEETL